MGTGTGILPAGRHFFGAPYMYMACTAEVPVAQSTLSSDILC